MACLAVRLVLVLWHLLAACCVATNIFSINSFFLPPPDSFSSEDGTEHTVLRTPISSHPSLHTPLPGCLAVFQSGAAGDGRHGRRRPPPPARCARWTPSTPDP
jgi:hypothetical protein